MNQFHVISGELQRPEDHLVEVVKVPLRFHDTVGGVPADAFQHVSDLMGHHMAQKRSGKRG